MKSLCSRLSASLKTMGTIFFFLSLVLLSADKLAAQPGDQRTPEEIRNDLNKRLEMLDRQIDENDRNPYNYQSRGQVYTRLYGMAAKRIERQWYAERAFADFARAMELDGGPYVFISRAELSRAIWMYETSKLAGKSPTEIIEAYYRNPNFDDAVSDYLAAIRQLNVTRRDGYNDERIRELFISLSYLYFSRAQAMARMPEVVLAMGQPYPIWDDFAAAIKYGKKLPSSPRDFYLVIDFYFNKVDTALAMGDYTVALDACQDGHAYIEENVKLISNYYGAESGKRDQQSYAGRLSYRRAKAYLRLGDAEKALEDLDFYLNKGDERAHVCVEFYSMRAQAHRLLGHLELAQKDEQTLSTLAASSGSNSSGCGV